MPGSRERALVHRHRGHRNVPPNSQAAVGAQGARGQPVHGSWSTQCVSELDFPAQQGGHWVKVADNVNCTLQECSRLPRNKERPGPADTCALCSRELWALTIWTLCPGEPAAHRAGTWRRSGRGGSCFHALLQGGVTYRESEACRQLEKCHFLSYPLPVSVCPANPACRLQRSRRVSPLAVSVLTLESQPGGNCLAPCSQ